MQMLLWYNTGKTLWKSLGLVFSKTIHFTGDFWTSPTRDMEAFSIRDLKLKS